MNTLDLAAAAAFLGVHPETLRERAAAGMIPGAKLGKEWRFLDVDLADYMRGQYRGKACSTDDPIPPSGISTSAILAADALDALLGQPTGTGPKGNTTNLRLVSGRSGKPGASSPTPSTHGPRRRRAARVT